jgi:hypothetical protein
MQLRNIQNQKPYKNKVDAVYTDITMKFALTTSTTYVMRTSNNKQATN